MNHKGFTLVEMLATLLLLGLIITIVLVSANKLIKTSDEKYYKTQEHMFLLAGKEYFVDYRNSLPKTIGETTRVTLKTLVKEAYIEPIKSVTKEDCHGDNSYVEVTKQSSTNYTYKVKLSC